MILLLAMLGCGVSPQKLTFLENKVLDLERENTDLQERITRLEHQVEEQRQALHHLTHTVTEDSSH